MLLVQPIWYGQQCNEQRKKELATVNYLFLISIGPVQDFIASARRSRDLWFGSWLLSELSKAAAHQLATSHGVDNLIFPTPETIQDVEPGTPLNVANKIMAAVKADDAKAVHALGEQVEAKVRERLETLRTEVYGKVKGQLDTEDDALKQVSDMLEIFWAAVPLPDPEQYQDARQHLEGLMAARKVTRDVSPVTWGGNRPMSSLDGQRESVIPKTAYPNPETAYPKRNNPQRADKINNLYTQYGAGEAERLSGVDLLKRHGFVTRPDGSAEERFMSTSHVAVLPLLKRLAAVPGARDTWRNYLDQLRTSAVRRELVKREKIAHKYAAHTVLGQYDGSLLFQERLPDVLAGTPEDELQEAKGDLEQFYIATFGRVIAPLPYYALLHADGDNMGKVIDATKTITGHQELSRALSGFADKVQGIVEDSHSGALIYAGGDDVLALLPMHTVLACARDLANRFREDMQKYTAPVDEDDPDLGMVSPTLSAGIAVCHHIEPFSDALELARKAEKEAKSVPGKDALAVTVSKRSGGDRTVVGQWQSGEDVATALAEQWRTLDQRLERFVELHRKDEFPDGAAYELHDLYLRVGQTLPPEALQAEVIRILKRKRAQGGKTKIDEPVLQNIEQVLNLADMTLERLANEIIIARIFADADRQAHPDTDKQAKEQPDAALDH